DVSAGPRSGLGGGTGGWRGRRGRGQGGDQGIYVEAGDGRRGGAGGGAGEGNVALGAPAGGVGRAGTRAFMLRPGMADVAGRSPVPSVGASAISVGAAGRSLCDSDAARNCLRGSGAGLDGCSATGCSLGSGVPTGAGAAASLVPGGRPAALAAVASCCSCSGEGGRNIRTDSLVVAFCDLSITCILKLMSLPEGEYMMLPMANCARSICTFSCCAPSVMSSTALLALRMESESRFQVSSSSPRARSTRSCN